MDSNCSRIPRGRVLQFFTTHADLVRRPSEARAAKKAEHERQKKIKSDEEWQGEDFVKQTDVLSPE